LAAFLASRGVHVHGVERDPQREKMIREGRLATNEPGLAERIARHRDRVEIADLPTALAATDLSFVVVPTAARPDGSLGDGTVQEVLREIGRLAAESGRPHLIAVVSTLSPGSCVGTLWPLLASIPRARVRLCYSPVFVALGNVLDDLEDPAFVLVGADDVDAGHQLAAFYARIGYDPALTVRMGFIDAEIAKLTLNTLLATKIAFANEVAAICEATPGADVDCVLGLVARDRRVGSGFLTGGAPVGGPCLPRDTDAFIQLAKAAGVEALIGSAVRASNEEWYGALLQKVKERAPAPGATIAILGLAYKSRTDYAEGGFGLRLGRDLVRDGYQVIAHDPGLPVRHAAPCGVELVDDLDEVLGRAHLCVLTRPDGDLAASVTGAKATPSILDVWRSTRRLESRSEAGIFWVGVGKDPRS
jgi:UDPglucose 6-dehydrogenase